MPRPKDHPGKPATAPKAKTRRVKVVATRTGYYDHARRREGDVFIIEEADFSDADRTDKVPAGWMRRVPANTPESISTSQDAIDKAHDDLLQTKAGGKADADVI